MEAVWAYVDTQGVPMLGQVGTMLSHLGPILGLCWAKSGLALQPSSFWSVASVFHPSWHPLSCPFGIASQARSPLGSLESADIHNSNSTFDLPEAIVEYVWKNLVPELCEITYFFRLGHDGQ